MASQRALYIDARKALNGEHRLGWTIDRVEIADAAEQVEPSACYVTPEQRAELTRWVSRQVELDGGPAAAQFKAGKSKSDLGEVIDLERTKALLASVEEHVPADCPFWVQPDPHFHGIHSTARRFTLIAESMGGGALLVRGHQVRASGGGAARLFASYGFSQRIQLAVGGEGGGDAVLVRDKNGVLSPAGVFKFGAPAFLRLTDIDRIYDLEVAALTQLKGDGFDKWGGRIQIAGGVSGLRRLHLMPAIEVYVGYEIFPAQQGEIAQHSFRVGTRVGLDWDP